MQVRPDRSTSVARLELELEPHSGLPSAHQQKARRLVSRFRGHLCHHLPVGPSGPPRYSLGSFPNLSSPTPLFTLFTGEPFSLQQYYARYENRRHSKLHPSIVRLTVITICTPNSCHTNGSLALLFLPISRHSKNILRSANHSASLSVASPHPAAWKPRVSLIGSVTVFRDVANTPDEDETASCYLKRHPDAVHWLPKDKHQPHVVSMTSQQPFFRVINVADHRPLGILGEV
jgi:hypothetical protein